MKYRVIVLEDAEEDLRRNTRWWAENHSPEQAARWYEFASKALFKLMEFPERHATSSENAEFPYEIRDFLFGLGSRPGYRAVFTIKDDAVYVLAICRGSQDTLTVDDVDFQP